MIWGTVLSILDKLLSLFLIRKVEVEQRNAQKSRDYLEVDPAGFFRDHFGGMPDTSRKAAPTDKTNTERG